jgi:hypothetical protein
MAVFRATEIAGDAVFAAFSFDGSTGAAFTRMMRHVVYDKE